MATLKPKPGNLVPPSRPPSLALQEEALSVSSALHTIRLRQVTSSNHTFVDWSTDYSADGTLLCFYGYSIMQCSAGKVGSKLMSRLVLAASSGVVMDSKFKKLDGEHVRKVCLCLLFAANIRPNTNYD